MIQLIISGFQTGADIGGIRAAKDVGVATGGWMPSDWRNEEGPHPEYARLYGARSCGSTCYEVRTEANVRDCDCTLWFGEAGSPAFWKTYAASRKHDRPIIRCGDQLWRPPLGPLLADIGDRKVVNIAGNRESRKPGIEKYTYACVRRIIAAQREAADSGIEILSITW